MNIDIHRLAYEEARQEIARIDAELSRLQAERDAAEGVSAYHQKRIPQDAKVYFDRPLRHIDLGPEKPTNDPYAGMAYHDVAEKLLRESKLPMRTIEMARLVQSRGHAQDSEIKSVVNGLYTAMSR